MPALLLSLKPRFARAILAGTKRAELRRVLGDVAPATRVVLYASQPACAIVGVCVVRTTLHATPARLWTRVRDAGGVSRGEFFAYFADKSVAHALEVVAPTPLAAPLTLDALRDALTRFQPPQSWRWLREERVADAALLRLVDARRAVRQPKRRRLARAA